MTGAALLQALVTAAMVAQCALVAGLLLAEHRNRVVWLAVFFAVFAVRFLGDLLVKIDDYLDPHLSILPLTFTVLAAVSALAPVMAPAIYLQTRATLSVRPVILSRATALHFVPTVLALAVIVPVYLIAILNALGLISPGVRDLTGFTLIDVGLVEWLLLMAQIAFYLLASIRLVYLHMARLRDVLSTIGEETARRARSILTLIAVLWVAEAGQFTLSWPRTPESLSPGPAWFATTLVLYALGIYAIRRPPLFEAPEVDVEPPAEARYERSPLSEDDVTRIAGKLERAMRVEGAYRDASLTLRHLSQATRVSEHKISQVLNLHLGRSFFAYVNGWRVAEAKRLLIEAPERSVQEISLDAGFNSRSTFNKVFKEETGQTPSEFRSGLSAETRLAQPPAGATRKG